MEMPSLIFTVAGLLIAANTSQADQNDLQKLQGTWKLISAAQDGRPLPNDKAKQTTIVFKGDSFLFPGLAENATSTDGTIKVDATKKPKEMDATSTEGEVMLGIYELSGDDYKVCFAPAGKARPSQFGSKPGSGYILQVWARTKSQ